MGLGPSPDGSGSPEWGLDLVPKIWQCWGGLGLQTALLEMSLSKERLGCIFHGALHRGLERVSAVPTWGGHGHCADCPLCLPQALFALSSMLRHFPYAQQQFLKLGGLQVLRSLFQQKGMEPLHVRVVTLLYDLIMEKVRAGMALPPSPPNPASLDTLTG